MKEVKSGFFCKAADLESGAKLINVYDASGNYKLKKGRMVFFDTKWKTIY